MHHKTFKTNLSEGKRKECRPCFPFLVMEKDVHVFGLSQLVLSMVVASNSPLY